MVWISSEQTTFHQAYDSSSPKAILFERLWHRWMLVNHFFQCKSILEVNYFWFIMLMTIVLFLLQFIKTAVSFYLVFKQFGNWMCRKLTTAFALMLNFQFQLNHCTQVNDDEMHYKWDEFVQSWRKLSEFTIINLQINKVREWNSFSLSSCYNSFSKYKVLAGHFACISVFPPLTWPNIICVHKIHEQIAKY